MAFGCQQADRGQRAQRDVPGRQNAIKRLGQIARSGCPREAGGGIDGVVDLAGSIRISGECDHDEVGAPFGQGLVSKPSAGGKIGQEQSALLTSGSYQRSRKFAAGAGAEVQLNRALALVQSRPKQTLAAGGERPSMVVEAAATLVEADHIGAKLGECHAAEWRCYKCGSFNNA